MKIVVIYLGKQYVFMSVGGEGRAENSLWEVIDFRGIVC